MGIVAGPKALLRTVDATSETIVSQTQLTTTNNLSVYPAHDGRFLWLTRLTTNTVTPFDLETLTFGTTVNINTNPVGICIDGRFLWSIIGAGTLRQGDLETGTIVDASSLPASTYRGLTCGIHKGERFFWTIDITAGTAVQFDPYTSTVIGTFTAPANPVDLHFDGRYLWFLTGAAGVQGRIRQFDPETGTSVGLFNVRNYTISDSPVGICGDSRFLYHTELVQ